MITFNINALFNLEQRLLPGEAKQICDYINSYAWAWTKIDRSLYFKPGVTNLSRAIQIAPNCKQVFIHFNRKKKGDVPLAVTEFKTISFVLELIKGWWFVSAGERKLPSQTTQFSNEVSFFQQLKGSPHILQLESVISYWGVFKNIQGQTHSQLKRRLTVEYADLGDLQMLLNLLTDEQKKIVFEDLIKKFADLHRRGITHHDIKPENILLSRQNPLSLKVIVGDLGCMKRFHQQVDTINGTDWYWSPEYAALARKIFQDQEIDIEEFENVNTILRDVWALGLTLVQILDNKFEFPWKSDSLDEVIQNLAQLPENWLKEPSAKNSPHHLAWEMLSVDPAKRLSVEAAEQRLPQLNWAIVSLEETDMSI